MRHRYVGRKLNRTSSHRQALLKNLAIALLENEAITTTLPKAKELSRYLEPMITAAKSDSVHGRRVIFSKLRNKEAVSKLFDEIGPRFGSRPGGYIRVLKAGFRVGDAAPMAQISFVKDETS